MNGKLLVESEVWRGSTFQLDVEFPAYWIDDIHQQPILDRGIRGVRRTASQPAGGR